MNLGVPLPSTAQHHLGNIILHEVGLIPKLVLNQNVNDECILNTIPNIHAPFIRILRIFFHPDFHHRQEGQELVREDGLAGAAAQEGHDDHRSSQ